MTGILITKQNTSGQSYYYIKLSYKDPLTHKWRQKMVATHLETRGNKRRAEALKSQAIADYSYMETLPDEYNTDLDPDITLCDYVENWLKCKKSELERSTYESYEYRASKIISYFKVTNPRLRDVTAGMADKFISYLLQYGKTDQKTAEKGPLAVRIQHTVVRVKTTEAKDSAKTINSYRTLALFHTAEQCLAKIKADQDINRKFFGADYHNSQYIFTWEDGKPYDPNYISKLFCKATKAYGRPEITLHKLRHTCASLLINKGWDVKKLQYWLGHSDTSTTLNIYSHFNKERMNEMPDDLEQLSESCSILFQ